MSRSVRVYSTYALWLLLTLIPSLSFAGREHDVTGTPPAGEALGGTDTTPGPVFISERMSKTIDRLITDRDGVTDKAKAKRFKQLLYKAGGGTHCTNIDAELDAIFEMALDPKVKMNRGVVYGILTSPELGLSDTRIGAIDGALTRSYLKVPATPVSDDASKKALVSEQKLAGNAANTTELLNRIEAIRTSIDDASRGRKIGRLIAWCEQPDVNIDPSAAVGAILSQENQLNQTKLVPIAMKALRERHANRLIESLIAQWKDVVPEAKLRAAFAGKDGEDFVEAIRKLQSAPDASAMQEELKKFQAWAKKHNLSYFVQDMLKKSPQLNIGHDCKVRSNLVKDADRTWDFNNPSRQDLKTYLAGITPAAIGKMLAGETERIRKALRQIQMNPIVTGEGEFQSPFYLAARELLDTLGKKVDLDSLTAEDVRDVLKGIPGIDWTADGGAKHKYILGLLAKRDNPLASTSGGETSAPALPEKYKDKNDEYLALRAEFTKADRIEIIPPYDEQASTRERLQKLFDFANKYEIDRKKLLEWLKSQRALKNRDKGELERIVRPMMVVQDMKLTDPEKEFIRDNEGFFALNSFGEPVEPGKVDEYRRMALARLSNDKKLHDMVTKLAPTEFFQGGRKELLQGVLDVLPLKKAGLPEGLELPGARTSIEAKNFFNAAREQRKKLKAKKIVPEEWADKEKLLTPNEKKAFQAYSAQAGKAWDKSKDFLASFAKDSSDVLTQLAKEHVLTAFLEGSNASVLGSDADALKKTAAALASVAGPANKGVDEPFKTAAAPIIAMLKEKKLNDAATLALLTDENGDPIKLGLSPEQIKHILAAVTGTTTETPVTPPDVTKPGPEDIKTAQAEIIKLKDAHAVDKTKSDFDTALTAFLNVQPGTEIIPAVTALLKTVKNAKDFLKAVTPFLQGKKWERHLTALKSAAEGAGPTSSPPADVNPDWAKVKEMSPGDVINLARSASLTPTMAAAVQKRLEELFNAESINGQGFKGAAAVKDSDVVKKMTNWFGTSPLENLAFLHEGGQGKGITVARLSDLISRMSEPQRLDIFNKLSAKKIEELSNFDWMAREALRAVMTRRVDQLEGDLQQSYALALGLIEEGGRLGSRATPLFRNPEQRVQALAASKPDMASFYTGVAQNYLAALGQSWDSGNFLDRLTRGGVARVTPTTVTVDPTQAAAFRQKFLNSDPLTSSERIQRYAQMSNNFEGGDTAMGNWGLQLASAYLQDSPPDKKVLYYQPLSIYGPSNVIAIEISAPRNEIKRADLVRAINWLRETQTISGNDQVSGLRRGYFLTAPQSGVAITHKVTNGKVDAITTTPATRDDRRPSGG